MRMHWLAAAALLATAAQSAEAQETAPLSGQVVDASTGAPIFRAVVRGVESGDTALTDESGAFVFSPQPAGLVTLEVITSRYHIETFRLTLTAGQPHVAKLALQPIGETGADVMVIEARRETVEPVVRTISVAELQRIPGTFGDAVRAVQNLPGVSRSPFGLGALIIRGTEPGDTGIYVDGVKVPLIFHFGGLTTTLNSDVLDRVEFIPGGFTARYGRNLGGVVDVATKEFIPLAPTGYADIDLFDTTLFFATPIGDDHGLTFSVRRSYIDLVIGAALGAVGGPEGQGPDIGAFQLPVYEDYQLMWDHRRGDNHRFHVTLFGSRDRFSIEGSNPDNEDAAPLTASLNTINHKLVGRWTWVPNERLTSKMTLGVGPDSNTLTVGPIIIDASPWSLFLREDLTYELNPLFTLKAGLDGLFQWYDFNLTLPAGLTEGDGEEASIDLTETTDINSAPLVLSPSPYAEADVRLGSLVITPGLRLDPYYVYDTDNATRLYAGVNLDPRLNLTWRVGTSTTVKGSVGRYANGVQPFALFGLDEGAEPPPLEWAFQSSIGAEHRFTREIGLSATAFWSEQRDLLVAGGREGGIFGYDGAGFSRGLEMLLRHDPGEAGFFGWISYTLSEAQRVDDLTNACPRSGGETGCSPWYTFDYDQTHIFTAVASQRLKRGWEVGARFRYTTGSPYTPQELAYYDFDQDTYVALSGETNSDRMPAFHQLDLRIDKRWTRSWGEISANLEVLNLYNRANPEIVQYSYDYSQTGYITGIPFFPSFGLKVTYR